MLGFSNTSRLNLLKHEAKQLEVQLEQYALSVAQSRKVLDQVTQHKSLWERMLRYQWDMINIPYWTERQQQTSNDLQHLQRADTNIEQARQRWELAKEELKQLQEQKGQLQHTWGKLKQKFSDAEKQQQQAQKAANRRCPRTSQRTVATAYRRNTSVGGCLSYCCGKRARAFN